MQAHTRCKTLSDGGYAVKFKPLDTSADALYLTEASGLAPFTAKAMYGLSLLWQLWLPRES